MDWVIPNYRLHGRSCCFEDSRTFRALWAAITEILTHRGAQFVNKLVKILCATYGTKFSKTPIAHFHENNVKVEKANKQILQILHAVIYEERVMNDWSRAIPEIQYNFNTTKHRDIGYWSAELWFGPANNLNQFVTDKHENIAAIAVGGTVTRWIECTHLPFSRKKLLRVRSSIILGAMVRQRRS